MTMTDHPYFPVGTKVRVGFGASHGGCFGKEIYAGKIVEVFQRDWKDNSYLVAPHEGHPLRWVHGKDLTLLPNQTFRWSGNPDHPYRVIYDDGARSWIVRIDGVHPEARIVGNGGLSVWVDAKWEAGKSYMVEKNRGSDWSSHAAYRISVVNEDGDALGKESLSGKLRAFTAAERAAAEEA